MKFLVIFYRVLHKCARENDAAGLSTACGYLLCSIVRTYPEHLDELLRLCGLGNFALAARSNASDERKGAASVNAHLESLNPSDLRVLALVAQSGLAVRALEARGVLTYLVNILTSMCMEGKLLSFDIFSGNEKRFYF